MTTPGHSPPGSKKESSAAPSAPTAGSIVADLDEEASETVDPDVPAPLVDDADPDRTSPDSPPTTATAGEAERREREAARIATRQARVDAKQAAKLRRAAAKQAKRDAKEERRRERTHAKQDAREQQETEKPTPDPVELEASESVPDPEPGPDAETAAPKGRRESKAAARRAKAAAKRDRIVEAPREPKASFLDRRRQRAAARDDRPDSAGRGRGVVAVAAVAVGVIALVCSLLLALGAFLAGLGADESNRAYDLVSGACDVLVGPLRGVFAFSGTDADMKEAVVAWGLGAMAYVLVGLFAQSYLRSRSDD